MSKEVENIVAGWDDAQRAVALEALLTSQLGPEAFDVQCRLLTSCPNEYLVVDGSGNILLFLRPPHDKHFAFQWHYSGTTVKEARAGGDIWAFVREKYRLYNMVLSMPRVIGYDDIQMGTQADGHNPRGAERVLLHIVRYFDGATPPGGTWFAIRNLPSEVIGHHKAIIERKLIPYLDQRA